MKELSKELELKMMAETLPKTPPLTPNGDLQFLDFVQDYSEQEQDKIWGLYKAKGGMMEKKFGITIGNKSKQE